MKRQILIINIFSRPHSDVSFTSYSCGTISRKNWNQKRKTRTTPPSVNHFISSEPHRKNTKYATDGIKEMMQPIPFRYRNFLIKPNSETSCNMAIFLNVSYLDPYQPLSREIRYKTRSRKEGGGGKARGRQL